MRIFLTGATGFIGSKFLLLALRKGHFIFALTRKKKNFVHKNIKWLNGSISKKWSHELKNSDIIVHLASEGVKNKKISYKKIKKFNVTSSLSLFKNAEKNNCKKWVIAGSASEYGLNCNKKNKLNIKTKAKPETNYEKTKYMFSKKILLLSKKTMSKCRLMRIFPVYGEGENEKRFYPSLVKAAKKHKNFIVKNSNLIRDFTSVDLAARMLLDACNFNKKKFKTYQIWHISSGKPLSLKNFAKKNWKKYNSKGKLIFKKLQNKNCRNYISDHKSIWQM